MSDQGIAISLDELIKLRFQAGQCDLFHQKRTKHTSSGEYLSTFRGRGLDFDEVRSYTPGDDIRAMDWRVLARTGVPHTKLYREEHERPVYFAVDYNESMFFGSRVAFKSVIAAKLATLLAWSACDRGDKVGGIVFSGKTHIECRPRSGRQGILPLLKTLADTPEPLDKSESLLVDTLKRLRSVCKPGSLIFFISDFFAMNEKALQQFFSLSKRNDVKACLISDPLEVSPPPPGNYTVSDGEAELTFNTYSKEAKNHYQAIFAKQRLFVTDALKARGIQYAELQTNSLNNRANQDNTVVSSDF